MDPVLQKFIQLKNAKKQDLEKKDTAKGDEKNKVNKNIKIVEEEESAINKIINEKPKVKVVVEYLQDRVDELNEAELG